jgi:hypothetical protein
MADRRRKLMSSRICSNCEGPVPAKRRQDALYCSDRCGNQARGRRFYDAHRAEEGERRLIYLQDYPRKIHTRVKSRAKALGISFNLDVADIVIPQVCPVLGIPLRLEIGRKGYSPYSPSVDRIKPELGYIKGNVRVISARANLLKNNATLEELLLVVQDMERLHVS